MRFDYKIGAYNDSTSWCGLLWCDLGISFVKIKESPEGKEKLDGHHLTPWLSRKSQIDTGMCDCI